MRHHRLCDDRSQGPAASAAKADRVEIAERSFAHPDASRLLRAFYEEQVGRYGFADPVDEILRVRRPQRRVRRCVPRGAPVGCGGYRWFDRRGRHGRDQEDLCRSGIARPGAGRALLSWLERHAVADGARRAILETGVRNTAALSLFTSAGYRPSGTLRRGP